MSVCDYSRTGERKHILQYIKDKREIKKSIELKRTFNKGMKKGTAKVNESSGYESEPE